MKIEDLEKITNSIREKLGEENSALISDDLASIITDNSLTNTLISEKDTEITKLKKDKENLVDTNSKLFQQVSVGIEEKEEVKNNEDKKTNFREFFDEKGNFI